MSRLEHAALGVTGGALVFTVAASLLAATGASAGTVGAAVGPLVPVPAPQPVEVTVPAPPVTTPVFLARRTQSPCRSTTARYRAAQRALADGDIDAADDLAILAAALIAQCGWTPVDAALGGPRR